MRQPDDETFSVLLVEDNRDQAAVIGEVLSVSRNPAFGVQHEARLARAVERLKRERFDVVLLDLNLPDSVGPACIHRVRRTAPDTPVIILTNLEDESTAAQCVREGAQDYLLKKEMEPRTLERAIRYATERAKAEGRLRESEERYAVAVAGANDGIWDWRVEDGRVYYSARWKAILGFEEHEIGEHIDEWFERVHEQDASAFRSALDAHLAGRSPHFEHEHRLRRKDGTYLWALSRGLAVRDARGKAYRCAGSISDISRRKRAEHQLIHDALHDPLTELPNRTLFMDRLDLALKRFRRNPDRLFAVLYFDLDRFKTINDSLGHLVGDELLVQVARRVERILRPDDTLARLGGDEFAVLVNDVTESYHATFVAERLYELLEEVFDIQGHEVYTSASIGIALSTAEYRRPEDVLRDSDLAMYRAKAGGGARFEMFDGAMHESALALHRLETDLRHAVDKEEFTLHYQPIVSLETGRILGFEALLRWQHPQWGLVSPDYFIEAAEETGLVVPIGWWVLNESGTQARVWQEMFPLEPPLSMSVNVSGKLVAQPDMAARLGEVLAATGLSAESLRLEITESAIMSHGSESMRTLRTLRDMGVQLHMDDFGTGYSSLSYLQRFAYDTLKIDRSFVSSINGQPKYNAIVGAIIALGESLGIKVIAEGVETAQQLEALRDMRCPQAQGYWFSRPLDRASVGALLTEALDR